MVGAIENFEDYDFGYPLNLILFLYSFRQQWMILGRGGQALSFSKRPTWRAQNGHCSAALHRRAIDGPFTVM